MSEHELWNELGNLYFLSGAYNQAVDAFQRSIQLDDGFGKPYSNLALAYVQQGEYEKAIALYKKSIELSSDNKEKASSWNRLGNVYVQLKNYQEAVFAYQVADELEEKGDEYFQAINVTALDTFSELPDEMPEIVSSDVQGLSYDTSTDAVSVSVMRNDDAEYQQDFSAVSEAVPAETWSDANIDWETILNTPDEDVEVFMPNSEDDGLSGWLPIPEVEMTEEIETVTNLFDSPLEELSNEEDYTLQVSEVPLADAAPAMPETKNRKYEYNEQLLLRVELDIDEKPAPVVGFDHKSTENMSAAQAEYERINFEDHTFESVEDEIDEIKLEISKFKRVVQINPKNAAAWDALGTHYKAAGMYKDAILAYQQAISADPSKGFYSHHLALVYAADGRNEDAIMALQKVIEIDPDHSLANAALGGYYRKMGLEELAQKHIGKAMKNIYNSESEYNQACLEAICGNSDQAIELLRIALQEKQTYVNWVMHDPDLDTIRENPRFKQLISDFIK